MSVEGRTFPEPPGQSSLRIEPDSEPLVITNLPTREGLLEQLRPLGPVGPILVSAGPGLARGASCFVMLFQAWGWMFLIFGLCFFGYMLIQAIAAGKVADALPMMGFGVFWCGFCALWIWVVRTFAFPRDNLDQHWRLVLGPESWVSYRATLKQRVGQCVPTDIQSFSRLPNGRVTANLMTGRSVSLTGPLPAADSIWLCDALADYLGLEPSADQPVFPYVPAPNSKSISPGTSLAWRLKRSDAPWMSVFIALGICLFWNGIVSVFLAVAFWGEAKVNWSLALFMIPFVLVGLVIFVVLIGTIWSAIVQSKIGPTFIELAAHPLEPGQTCQALLSQAGPLTLKVFNVRMICTESARYVQGTTTRTDTKKVREFIVFEQFEVEVPGGTPLECPFDLTVPADAMHSFESSHNGIEWQLLVCGEPEGWPAFQRTFAVIVNPAGRLEEQT